MCGRQLCLGGGSGTLCCTCLCAAQRKLRLSLSRWQNSCGGLHSRWAQKPPKLLSSHIISSFWLQDHSSSVGLLSWPGPSPWPRQWGWSRSRTGCAGPGALGLSLVRLVRLSLRHFCFIVLKVHGCEEAFLFHFHFIKVLSMHMYTHYSESNTWNSPSFFF